MPPLTHVPLVQYSGGPDDRPNERMPPLTHVPELMSVQYSGGPDDRPSERMPPLTHVPEILSAPLSGAGEGTRADPDDDIHNDLIPRQPEDEPAGDDDLPTHPPFNYYVQGYDRTDGTQSAPPSIEREGDQIGSHPAAGAFPKDPFQASPSEEPGPGPEIESTKNNITMFRESGHVIAALTDASAPQSPSNDVNVKDSGQQCAPTVREGEAQIKPADCGEQGEKFPFATNLSIKATPPVSGKDGGSSEIKSYADCFRNKSHFFPGAAHEYAATLAGVVDADGEPRSEAAGKEPSSDAYDFDECDFYAQGSSDDAYDYGKEW